VLDGGPSISITLLLDGLDEVPSNELATATGWLAGL